MDYHMDSCPRGYWEVTCARPGIEGFLEICFDSAPTGPREENWWRS
jgi:hypothetical protein